MKKTNLFTERMRARVGRAGKTYIYISHRSVKINRSELKEAEGKKRKVCLYVYNGSNTKRLRLCPFILRNEEWGKEEWREEGESSVKTKRWNHMSIFQLSIPFQILAVTDPQKHLLILVHIIYSCIKHWPWCVCVFVSHSWCSCLFLSVSSSLSISHHIDNTGLSLNEVFSGPRVSCSSHRPQPSLSMPWHRSQRDTHTNPHMHNIPTLASFPL